MKTWRVFMLTKEECAKMNGSFSAVSEKNLHSYGTCRLLLDDSAAIQEKTPPVLDTDLLPPLPPT